MTIPENVKTVIDPQYSTIEWCFVEDTWYQRHINVKAWIKVSRPYITPDRVKMLYKLMKKGNK